MRFKNIIATLIIILLLVINADAVTFRKIILEDMSIGSGTYTSPSGRVTGKTKINAGSFPFKTSGFTGFSANDLIDGDFDLTIKPGIIISGGPAISILKYDANEDGAISGAEFATMVSGIGATQTTLTVDAISTVSATVALPSTLSVRFISPGKLAINSGVTLTINGTLDAVPYQIFSGDGLIDLSGTSIDDVYAEWWGIDGTADEVEINKAIVAANQVNLLEKTYIVADTIKFKSGTVITGINKRNTIISGSLTKAVMQSIAIATRYYDVILERFKIDNTNKANAGGVGIDFTKISTSIIRDVQCYNAETGILISGTAYYNDIYSPIMNTVVTGIDIESGANENRIFAGKIDTSTTGISIDQASGTQVYGTECANFTTGIDVAPAGSTTSTKIMNCRFENTVLGGTGINIGDANSVQTSIFGVYCQNLTKFVDLGTNTDTTIVGNFGGLTDAVNDNNALRQRGLIFSGIIAFTDADTTPSVTSGSIFETANTGATTVTAFDAGQEGQVIFVQVADGNTTFDFTSTTLKGNDGNNFTAASGDSMICANDGTNWNCTVSRATNVIPSLADDATPSIAGYNTWLTGGTTTVTDFDDGVEGQIIRVIAEHSVTITDGTNILLSGSANFVMTATDTLTIIQKADGKWYELARGDNGA